MQRSKAPPRILLHDDELPLLDRREEGGDVVAVAADRQVELGELADLVGARRPERLEHGLERGEFYILLLFSAFGAMVLARSTDMLTLFVGLETMSIGVYALAGFRRGSSWVEKPADRRRGRNRPPCRRHSFRNVHAGDLLRSAFPFPPASVAGSREP